MLKLLLVMIVVFAALASIPVRARSLNQREALQQTRGVNDFVEYWAVARLIIQGENPYSPQSLLNLQKSVGWAENTPLVMWNPPWVISFVLPFGLFPYSTAQFLWLLLNVVLILVSVTQLWEIYSKNSRGTRLALLISFTFVPVSLVLVFGQIGGLFLFGIVQFLRMQENKSWIGMGLATVLISIKPHPVYLFWIALILWIIEMRKFRVAVALFIGLTTATTVPTFLKPNLFRDYLLLQSDDAVISPFDLDTLAIGRVLRVLLKSENPTVQFLPCIVGVAWLLIYRHKRKQIWNWTEELPLLLLVSLTTTVFAWTYDLIIGLPALIQVTARIFRERDTRLTRHATALYIVITSAYWASKFFVSADFWSFWLPPVLLLAYLTTTRQTQRHSHISNFSD